MKPNLHSTNVRCPKCESELEGEFAFTDELRCPVCRTAFFPPIPEPTPGASLVSKRKLRPLSVLVVSGCWWLSVLDHLLVLAFPDPPKGALFRAFVSGWLAVKTAKGENGVQWLILLFSIIGFPACCISLVNQIRCALAEGYVIESSDALIFNVASLVLGLVIFGASLLLLAPRVRWWFKLPKKVPMP